MSDKKSNWTENRKKVLKCVSMLITAAAPFCPIINLAKPFIQEILNYVDDGDLEKLKYEFGKMHDCLNKILQMSQETLEVIQMGTIETQFSDIDENIVYQYNKYKEVIMAEPGNLKKKMAEFVECCENSNTDNNMRNIYNVVMGNTIFVNLEYSHVKKDAMEYFLNRLNYLFFIGFIAIMGYYEAKGIDLQVPYDQWLKKMNEVHQKLQERKLNIPAPMQPMS
nr:protein rapunzel-like isoform X1 [Misgurnus anguillicaudatus]